MLHTGVPLPPGRIAGRYHHDGIESHCRVRRHAEHSDEAFKDRVYYVVATWNGAQQIWREGFFESEEEAAVAFGRYLKDYYVAAPWSPALNPEIRKLEI